MNKTTNKPAALKLIAIASNAYRVVMIDMSNGKESTLVEVLECASEHVMDRAYALAAERGYKVLGHTIDINGIV